LTTSVPTRRVFLLGNPAKPQIPQKIAELKTFLAPHCLVVGDALGADGRPAIQANADRIIILGGDGTLIGVARSLGETQIPLIGVNVGKLGFLAEFSIDEIRDRWREILTDDGLISRRTVLHVGVIRDGAAVRTGMAINDCVIQAGAPFRMITLGVTINREPLTEVAGDGLIVCTPTGSTAHNLSAGGPIMLPDVQAIILTPLCPHSLTHRPIVVERSVTIAITALTVNEGTTAIIDGQAVFPLRTGDQVVLRRHTSDLLLVRNPHQVRWHKLVTKLHWGKAPNYDVPPKNDQE
jgi:NAD+ kinase